MKKEFFEDEWLKIVFSIAMIIFGFFHWPYKNLWINLHKNIKSILETHYTFDIFSIVAFVFVMIIWRKRITRLFTRARIFLWDDNKILFAKLLRKDKLFFLKSFITFLSIALLIVTFIKPELNVNNFTVALIIVAFLPWLTSMIQSAKFPGGWEIEFQDVQSAGKKITKDMFAMQAEEDQTSFLKALDLDSNLALVGLRIEIEKRLLKIGELNDIPEQKSLKRLFAELGKRKILPENTLNGLHELVMAGNQAAHGAKVEKGVANWAINYGTQVLSVLDFKIQESEHSIS